jgi:hypothetical protein
MRLPIIAALSLYDRRPAQPGTDPPATTPSASAG